MYISRSPPQSPILDSCVGRDVLFGLEALLLVMALGRQHGSHRILLTPFNPLQSVRSVEQQVVWTCDARCMALDNYARRQQLETDCWVSVAQILVLLHIFQLVCAIMTRCFCSRAAGGPEECRFWRDRACRSPRSALSAVPPCYGLIGATIVRSISSRATKKK